MKRLLTLVIVATSAALHAQTNWVQLTPQFIYQTNSNPSQWDFKSDHLESPIDTGKTYYFDGFATGDFDYEDTLMSITYGNSGNLFTNYFYPPMYAKFQHTEYRLPNGSFRPFYLYVAHFTNEYNFVRPLHLRKTITNIKFN